MNQRDVICRREAEALYRLSSTTELIRIGEAMMGDRTALPATASDDDRAFLDERIQLISRIIIERRHREQTHEG